MSVVGTVSQLWRFPVKSLRGERLESLRVGERGVVGDRAWGVAMEQFGTLMSAKRNAALLRCRAWTEAGGAVRVELPDGRVVDPAGAAETLGALVERKVRLVPVSEAPEARYDLPADYATMGRGKSMRFPCPPGTFFDLGHVHLVTTSTLQALGGVDVRRLRPNVLVETSGDGYVEDEWPERRLRVGSALLHVSMKTPRCVMTTREQDELARDRDVLKRIATQNGNNAGVYASVLEPGDVREGDEVDLE